MPCHEADLHATEFHLCFTHCFEDLTTDKFGDAMQQTYMEHVATDMGVEHGDIKLSIKAGSLLIDVTVTYHDYDAALESGDRVESLVFPQHFGSPPTLHNPPEVKIVKGGGGGDGDGDGDVTEVLVTEEEVAYAHEVIKTYSAKPGHNPDSPDEPQELIKARQILASSQAQTQTRAEAAARGSSSSFGLPTMEQLGEWVREGGRKEGSVKVMKLYDDIYHHQTPSHDVIMAKISALMCCDHAKI